MNWLRPSAIEGWRAVSRHLTDAPDDPVELVITKLRASYATAGLDYSSTPMLATHLGLAATSTATCYQLAIEGFSKLAAPTWLTAIPRGRDALVNALPVDAAECFRLAGLLSECPQPAALDLLDRLANLARAAANLDLVEQGRDAERRSYALECSRCTAIPGSPPVEWTALNDNTAGFDILSSRFVDGRVAPKLVEVKSSRASEPRMMITRNEWNTACRNPDSFVFHFWSVSDWRLLELGWRELANEMPSEVGAGRWEVVSISMKRLPPA